jgi:hypothetical protein
MKTTKNILIVTAAILLSITVNSQNTKSVHYASLTEKTTSFVSAKVNTMTHFLTTELESLKAVVIYEPSIRNEESDIDSNFDFSNIQEALMKDAKFYPAEEIESDNSDDNQSVMNSIIKELENETRFNPEASVLNDELSDLVLETSKDAKYIPSATM